MNEKINKSAKIDIKEGLKEICPEVFEDNKINFEKLKALLSGELIEKEDDRFYFNWAGKSELFKLIQAPAYGTLKPVKEKSIDFDKTENIVIVGENLETLKLLLKPYFGKIKMIYIDPPYNTGKDFIYRDNFKQPLKDYLEKTGQIDSEGKKLTTNTEASGRYHSDWLNFIYPRLFLARSLLRDDGVIFISIDDNEVHHLRMIMDEIFGEENFVANIIRITGSTRNMAVDIDVRHDYLVLYAKNKKEIEVKGLTRDKVDEFINPDNDPEGNWSTQDLTVRTGGYEYEIPSIDGTKVFRNRWRYNIDKMKTFMGGDKDDKFLEIYKKNAIKVNVKNKEWFIVGKIVFKGSKNVPNHKKYLKDVSDITVHTIWDDIESQKLANENLIEVFDGKKVFDNPKPVGLIKKSMAISTDKDSLILDFFAGSGTTGHAVWDLNKEDGGRRKFILVQLDEEVQDEEIKREFPTVADICIERLRRVSEKYGEENTPSANADTPLQKGNLDFGFKVFKLDRSNFNLKDEFEFDPSEDKEELKKKYLKWLEMWVDQPLVSGWQKIDVIYEVMLKEGLNLNSKIDEIKIKDGTFYYVKDEEQNLDFYINLEDKISKETIEEIRTSKYKGKMFVFLDNALTDSDKINLTTFVRLKVI
ncbi:MAG TPA: site-specific DNA-methyltransferase [bacterium]|nr:site-specific DNA-methyltransferase [bacterium]HPP08548.1 site-specific DNA-methyltransferase [bacterium]